MNTANLDKSLLKTIDGFDADINARYAINDLTPATKADINELAHYTFQALVDMRTALIEHLKNLP